MSGNDTDYILSRANELGILIQKTSVYCRYRDAAEVFEKDFEASRVLSEYESAALDIETRQRNGDIIESFELEALKDMAREAGRNEVIADYLEAKRAYAGLLEEIQKALFEVK